MSPSTRTTGDHHDRLLTHLTERVDDVVSAASSGNGADGARQKLARFARQDVLAHLTAEERILYPAAREASAGALVEVLTVDHDAAVSVIDQLIQVTNPLHTALLGRALQTLISLRVEKEEEILFPTLRDTGVDVAALSDQVVVEMASTNEVTFKYL